MNRIRSIKPEIRRNRKIADCGLLATLLSRELITYADDQGRFPASAREIKAECFPYHDALKMKDVEAAIQALAGPTVDFVELYEVGGERYGWLPGWFRHQLLKADRITWSELPPPPSFQPQMMSKALYARWLQDGAAGDLPPRGDGSIASPLQPRPVPNPDRSGSKSEPEWRQAGDASESSGSDLEPRATPARALTGTERTGTERTGTERTGGESEGRGAAGAAVRASRKSSGPPMGPEAVALIQGHQELGYAQPSASDLIRATEYIAELPYLTVPEMLDRMREHLAWCEREHKPKPQSLGGFWNTLRSENDHRRDNGAQQRDRGGGRVEGMVRLGDLLPGVQA